MTVPELLRAAGAWFKLAADEIDAGHDGKARGYVRMGLIGTDSKMVAEFLAVSADAPKEP